MPPRKKSTVKKVDVNAAPSRRLLDEKLVPRPQSAKRLSGIILGALILGVASGTALMFYFDMKKPVENSDQLPEITVPDMSGQASDIPATTPSTTSETVPTPVGTTAQMVQIIDTPTGYLNVRRGPGTGYGLIGQVHPGESYTLVSENTAAGWYEIKLSGGTGWITKQYSKLK